MRATKKQRKQGILEGAVMGVAGLVALALTTGPWHGISETVVMLGLALILGHSLGLYRDRNRKPDDEA